MGLKEKILNATLYVIARLEELNGTKLRRYQFIEAQKIIWSILTGAGEEITELWARQIGKTELGRYIILTLMVLLPIMARSEKWVSLLPQLKFYRDGFHVGLVAPKLELAQIPFRRLRDALRRGGRMEKLLLGYGIEVEVSNSKMLVLNNGSHAIAMSGNEGSFNEGETFHYLHFEECQRISRFIILKSFHPMVAATGGTMLKVGTPDIRRCSFKESIDRNRRYNPLFHGQYDMYWGIQANPKYGEFIKKEKERIGEDSDEFKMSFLLEWLMARGMLFDFALWQKMCGDGKDNRPLVRQGKFSEHRKVYGLDVAKVKDATVLTAGEVWGDHVRVVDCLRLEQVPYEQQYEIIGNYVRQVGLGTMVVDATGVGDPVVEGLTARGKIPSNYVKGHVYTASFKDALFKVMRDESQANRLFYPGEFHEPRIFDPRRGTFHKECLDCEIDQRGNLMTFHHPLDEEATAHDDHVDSMANMIFGALKLPIPEGACGFRF